MDNPRISIKKLVTKIFLGTFQLRLSKSYVGDLIKNGTAFVISEEIFKKSNITAFH